MSTLEQREGPAWENRKLAYHEAAHAVLMWNLGFGVRHVFIDRIHHCGNALACRNLKGREAALGNTVVSVAGLAAQLILEEELTWPDTVRSFKDFSYALGSFLTTERLTDGEQLALALGLTKRTARLLQEAEVRRQILALVPPLLQRGALVQRQVDDILMRLPETREAKRKCRDFVTKLAADRSAILQRVEGLAPDFRWSG